jgi:NADH/NAD ratio-sensing transcriptional regulator Rex
MRFKNPYWSNKTKIELLQKWILVHSIIYYQFDDNIATDAKYDANSKQLAELIKIDPGAHKASKWYYVFKDYGKDGSTTGYYLFTNLKKRDKVELSNLAEYVLKIVCKRQ